jgi:hypothetical protein
MRTPPPLRLEPRASRVGGRLVAAGGVATAALVGSLPLAVVCKLGFGAAVAGAVLAGIRACAGRGVPALLLVSADRRIVMRLRNGRSIAGAILDSTYVGARFTTIVWRPDARGGGWRILLPARTLLLLADSLPPEDFRQLRVVLRYGRPPTPGPGTSGVEAA